MLKLSNSSIKFRLLLLSLFGVVGFCVILVGNFMYFQKSQQQLETLQNVDMRLVQTANELQVGLADLNRLFEASVVEMDKDTLDDALQMAERQRKQIHQLAELGAGLQVDEKQLAAAFDQFVAENKSYADAVIAGRFEGDAMYSAFSVALSRREAYDRMLRITAKTINTNFSSTLQSLRERSVEVNDSQFTFAALLFMLFMLAVIWFIRAITKAITNVIGVAGQIANGNLDVVVDKGSSEEFDRLFAAMDVMRSRLKQQYLENEARQKRQLHLTKLNEALRGEKNVQSLGEDILRCMAEQLGTLVGAFFLYEHDELVLKATHAFTVRRGGRNRFALGESLVGQAALEQQIFVVRDLPDNYALVASGLGESVPAEVLLMPLTQNGRLLGVLELMGFRSFSSEDIDFVKRGVEGMAIAVHSAVSRVQLAEALDRTRQQAEALEQQQEELRATNEELEEQASVLRASEEHLQQQQEELRVMNEELEERNRLLDRQKEEIVQNNAALERSRRDLQEKAKQLELSGRYKSEFLSTMSHELRTPLNSILILSQGLMENRPHNLDEKQVEHARVIHSSGRDLLLLINDILDLSKVEEGKLELLPEPIALSEMSDKLKAQFQAQAEQKSLDFHIQVDGSVPAVIEADEQRLCQILRNFLSNAFKFTAKGKVHLLMERPHGAVKTAAGVLMPENAIAFRVQDSGIGIPLEKQGLIFEAFQQVDGTISRKYGGTGLGLTISRKLAELMGGIIQVDSAGEQQGSIFSLVVPCVTAPVTRQAGAEIPASAAVVERAAPLLPAIAASTNEILIVEDDPGFSRILHTLAEEFGFKARCVHTAADAYQYLEQHLPGSVILDLGLPDAPGQQLLEHLKSQPRTRDIPVHVVSGNTDVRLTDLTGAQEFIQKPFGRDRLDRLFSDIGAELLGVHNRRVLVIEDDPVQREQIQSNFERQNIACDLAASGEEALRLLDIEKYGAIILDLDLPDGDGFELVETIGKRKDALAHIIIYTARDISRKQDAELRRYADRVVLKTDKSIARLLNETSLFLDWLKGDPRQRGKEEVLPDAVEMEKGKRVLIVDDDIRNLYSLSAVLEDAGLEIATASTGVEALAALDAEDHFDLILMDIMMPEMDGFEAMRRIRSDERFSQIPIIALTAKAMRDDRARCIEAGANDYMSKPIDTGKLKAVIKLWLQQ